MKRVVLVSSDSKYFFTKCCAILSDYNYDTISISQHGGKVLSAIDEFSPDIVLIHFDMVQYNAVEVIKRVKEKPATKVPMYVVVYISLKDEQQLYSNGVENIFMKPVDIDFMIERIVTLYQRNLIVRI